MPDNHQMSYEDIIGLVAPGSELHEGLENILRAKTGGLILVSESGEVASLIEGGFHIDTAFSPASLYELAKMDGAIILSSDGKRILYANTQLHPDPSIPSSETGTRHRTAERVAKQTGALVISISQRRNIITLYRNDWKYVVKDVGVTLAKANQALQTLEKYRTVLLDALATLTMMEFDNTVTVLDVCLVIQKDQLLNKIADEIESYITELGTEGRLVQMQLVELMADIQDQGKLVIEDYLDNDEKTSNEVWEELGELHSEELVELVTIAKILGHSGTMNSLEQAVSSRGIRLLNKIPRLPQTVICNIVDAFGGLTQLLGATTDDLDDIEGIGEVRARAIQEGLRRLKSHALLEKQKTP
ncbi:MAG: DNA integrity scanning diadenylate cyclase DisA [Firmicutes bacterium]|nr:DNA integrity scanning diadenylate cyclase DisA [Bacillota bacterium]MDD4693085.1 DNA integrity scanning diadenylate cyclase DisA [Bacillota bacterium]